MEKLMPGAITPSARQKPQNKYHPKFGVITTDAAFRVPSKAKIITTAITMDTKKPFLLPCSPASRAGKIAYLQSGPQAQATASAHGS